jgi:glycosyltransferase involved in cell wall biosynthesis
MNTSQIKNKRIVFFAPSYYPNLGGVEKHIMKVANILKNDGYKIKIFVKFSKNIPRKQIVNGVSVFRMPRNESRPYIDIWYAKNKIHLEGAVIHSHDYFNFYLRKKLNKNRWVHTFHGYEGYPISKLAIESRRRVLGLVDYSFCVGKFIEKWYGTKCDEVLWGAADKPVAIKNIIKYDFLFYGRLEKDTGIKDYLKAFKLISDKNKSLKMLVVGWGSLENENRSYTQNNHLNVEFRSPVKDVYSILAESRIAFASGYQAIIESSLMKKPVIAFYDNPLKKDYLETHPQIKNFMIADSPEKISSLAIGIDENSLKINSIYKWALKQNWENIASKYEASYR